MTRPGEEGERRLIDAVAMYVERHVRERLPEHARGIHAPLLSRSAVRRRVREVLEDLIERVAEQVSSELPEHREQAPAVHSGRTSVLDNDRTCDVCGCVERVAVLTYEEGRVVTVECEGCAPEFAPE